MDTVVAENVNPYPRMLWWEVFNFMSIEHGKCEFDDRNIVNLKGYNDSGKSAMLIALRVLLYNDNPTKQVSFIQDDKDYFRVLASFEDGVQILRDKYINGQSLYEMYKDGKCIYSTKSGNTLTRVTSVPKPIADYLGLVMYDRICLNARSCFEKQIGVQTTGSENYKMFNTVLKSEEIAVASTLLNNDKNKLSSDIEATDYELQTKKNMLGSGDKITETMVNYLKEHDSNLDSLECKESSLNSIVNILSSLSEIPNIPEISIIDYSRLNSLVSIKGIVEKLSGVVIYPEVSVVDNSRLNTLVNIRNIVNGLNSIKLAPEIQVLNNERLLALQSISEIISKIDDCNSRINDYDNKLAALSNELEILQKELANKGVHMVKCPCCGQVFNPEESHIHAS